jgi:hypothetical protein
MSRTAEQIITAAEEHLKTATFGLRDIESSSPEKKTAGLLNVAVFGRSATFALQNLKSIVPEFEEWYKKKQDDFATDALMKFFNALRRKIEHEAHAPKVGGIHIQHLTREMLGPPPPNAIAAFLGDKEGRSGWRVRLPDGTEKDYYVDFPMVRPIILLQDAPENESKDAVVLAAKYLAKVGAVIAEARQHFIKPPPQSSAEGQPAT